MEGSCAHDGTGVAGVAGYLGFSPAPDLVLLLADKLAVMFVDFLPAEYFLGSSDGQLGIAQDFAC
jgi:hypothetical protein